jgi:hypothetical protein
MRAVRHISFALALLIGLASCSGGRDKVIPRAKLAEIYAEMLVTDQWITSTPGVRREADTSLVYEPILEKYGYTSADYRKSVDRYMDDPERFSRILRTSADILEKKLDELKKRKEEIDHLRALELLLRQLKYESDFRAEEFFPYLFDEPYVHYYDSLDVQPDSVLQIYRLKNIDRADTLYDGLRMVLKDSLAVKDTVQVSDSIATEIKGEE